MKKYKILGIIIALACFSSFSVSAMMEKENSVKQDTTLATEQENSSQKTTIKEEQTIEEYYKQIIEEGYTQLEAEIKTEKDRLKEEDKAKNLKEKNERDEKNKKIEEEEKKREEAKKYSEINKTDYSENSFTSQRNSNINNVEYIRLNNNFDESYVSEEEGTEDKTKKKDLINVRNNNVNLNNNVNSNNNVGEKIRDLLDDEVMEEKKSEDEQKESSIEDNYMMKATINIREKYQDEKNTIDKKEKYERLRIAIKIKLLNEMEDSMLNIMSTGGSIDKAAKEKIKEEVIYTVKKFYEKK